MKNNNTGIGKLFFVSALVATLVIPLVLLGCAGEKAAKAASNIKDGASATTAKAVEIDANSNEAIKHQTEIISITKTDPANPIAQPIEELANKTITVIENTKIIAKNIKEDQKDISQSADTVLKSLSHLTEKIPWWGWLLTLMFIVLILFGVIYLGERIGLFNILSGMTSKEKKVGTIIAKAQDPNDPFSINEATAALRSLSPTIDKEFTKVRKGTKNDGKQ